MTTPLSFNRREILALPLFLRDSARAQQPTAENYRPEAIQPSSEFPYVWQYRGKPALLLGASDEDNLFNHPELAERNLTKLARVGGNYVRCTMSSRDSGNVWPFASRDGRYDLSVWNPEYWRRLETFLAKARDLDVMVQMEIWATFDFYRENWLANPFNPANNRELNKGNSNLEAEWPHHPAQKPQPFFYSVPEHNNAKVLLAAQERYVEKLLSVSLPFPNVLYCSDNETKTPKEWGEYWARFVQRKAREQGFMVPFTEMWDAHDLHSPEHAQSYSRPDLYQYVDVSQNNWKVGRDQYERLIWYRENLAKNGGPRPMNNVKVYQRLEGGEPNDVAVSVRRWWQNVFAGCASSRFHRPDGGIGLSDVALQQIYAARVITEKFEWWKAKPEPERIAVNPSGACVWSVSGVAHAVYMPQGGAVRFHVDASEPHVWTIRYLNLEDGVLRERRTGLARREMLYVRVLDQRPWIALCVAR